MKYSENLVKLTISALEKLPFRTAWNVHIRTQYETFTEIRFEDVDGNQMAITLGETEINAITYSSKEHNGYKWFGSCEMKPNTKATYLMWLAVTTERMFNFDF